MKRFGDRAGALIFGPPGAGKGTYGAFLQRDFGFALLSPGELFRAAVREDRPGAAALAETMRRGEMVGDAQVLAALFDAVEARPASTPLMLDGVPRNVAQAEALAATFDLRRFFVLNVEMQREFLVEKLAGRRVCVDCGKGYNVCHIERGGYSLKPLLSRAGDACERCGGALSPRPDDTPAAIALRLELYDRETHPVLELLVRLGLPQLHFDPKRGVDDYPELRAQLAPFIAATSPPPSPGEAQN